MGILTTAKDWKVIADLDKQLRFPQEVQVQTQLRPDLIIYSKSTKKIIWWELTCPSEERISESHERKLDRYANLQVDCQTAGWSCYNMAIEVGAIEDVLSQKVFVVLQHLSELEEDRGKTSEGSWTGSIALLQVDLLAE